METPGAYAHKQNPKVERMNRTLQTAGRTQCIQAGLPEFFWPEAIRISTLVENRALTQSARQIGIPVAVLTDGVPPDVSYFRPFGCKVTVTVPPEKQSKTLSEPRARVGIYLGPGSQANTFRVWDAISQSITIVRDVVFHEDEYPGHDKRFYLKYFGKKEKWYGIAMSRESDETSANPPPESEDAGEVGGHRTDSPDPQLGTASRSQDVAANYPDHMECQPLG